jgi:hypothetical protein
MLSNLDSIHYPKSRCRLGRVVDVGALIMLGTLFGLVVLIFGLVLRFDPEARRSPSQAGDQ